jgi:membrane-associated phospholipid phosphatase
MGVHSVDQVIVGTIVGLAGGALWYIGTNRTPTAGAAAIIKQD